jgi:hypothetical protein
VPACLELLGFALLRRKLLSRTGRLLPASQRSRWERVNSDQFHALTGRGPIFSVKVQFAGSMRGAGPAVSTGKLSTKVPGESGPIVLIRIGGDFLRRRVKGAFRTTPYSAPCTQIPREVWCAVRGAVMPNPLCACAGSNFQQVGPTERCQAWRISPPLASA